jgi:hypothetical protein
MVSQVRQSIQYEMFDARSVPFVGDYNWVSLASTDNGISGYIAWTDNRDVVPGTDPREEEQDGFDVKMCVTVTDGVAGRLQGVQGPRAGCAPCSSPAACRSRCGRSG